MSGVSARPVLQSHATRHHEHLISKGEIHPLQHIPFHEGGPFVRWQMAGRGVHDDAPFHVAVHDVSHGVAHQDRSYCELHEHAFPELNVLLSPGRLVYRIQLGDEVYDVAAPASILIPPNLPHSANLLAGAGYFIALLACSTYEASTSTRQPSREHEA
jgi:hypothetical protein